MRFSLHTFIYLFIHIFYFSFSLHVHRNNSTHAQQPTSYHSSAETNAKRINSSETVEYALSKGTATEISGANGTHKQKNCNCQSADSQHIEMSSDLCKNLRDRLGLWGARNDAEVAGKINGLDRLRYGRFNKVGIF